MPEREAVRFQIGRGATVAEFNRFLADLESAYLALFFLPTIERAGRLRRRFLIDYLELDLFGPSYSDGPSPNFQPVYPKDQLEICRISIQSPGWIELIGSLNPLQQLREYLKDRHERKKDKEWRSASERDKAHLELEILKLQVERDQAGVIRDHFKLLEDMGFSPEERRRIIWDRLGPAMLRLGQHQDSGLLGSQNNDLDGGED